MITLVGTPKAVASGDTTFTLTNGDTAGRAVLIIGTQNRSPVNVTGFSFNSLAGTSSFIDAPVQNAFRVVRSYWQNSDLPATAGTYNVARSSTIDGGTQYVIIELSGVDNAVAPQIVSGALTAGGWSSPLAVNFANTNAGDFLAYGYVSQLSAGAATALSGQTIWSTSNIHPLATKISVAANESLSTGNLNASGHAAYLGVSFAAAPTGPDYTQRKGSTFTATHTMGTITTATLNAVNVFDHVSSQAAGTVSFTGAITDERTTSGVVDLVLGDGAATQTQTVQVNVFGVVPSNNPAQKDGSALASLTGVQIRITAGANLNGTQVYYSGTETTNASGNFSTLDVSTSAAVAADPVRMQVLTAAGDSITSAETVELI
jgi:hypothetical protein